MRRRQFYDPFVEVAPAPPAPVTATAPQPIQGLFVERPGIYLKVEDVAAALRQMAGEVDGIAAPLTPRETLLAAATSFEAIYSPEDDEPAPGERWTEADVG